MADNAASLGRHRVCTPCFALGCTPQDVERYTCAECGDKGHMKFRRDALKNYKKRGQRSDLVCLDCADRHKVIEGALKDKKAIRCTCGGSKATGCTLSATKNVRCFGGLPASDDGLEATWV